MSFPAHTRSNSTALPHGSFAGKSSFDNCARLSHQRCSRTLAITVLKDCHGVSIARVFAPVADENAVMAHPDLGVEAAPMCGQGKVRRSVAAMEGCRFAPEFKFKRRRNLRAGLRARMAMIRQAGPQVKRRLNRPE